MLVQYEIAYRFSIRYGMASISMMNLGHTYLACLSLELLMLLQGLDGEKVMGSCKVDNRMYDVKLPCDCASKKK